MDTKKPFCYKCLLEELNDASIAEQVKHTLSLIPEGQKVTDNVYRERLACCKTCEKLVSGMCRVCGCFVEVRAVYRRKSCPDVHPKWERTEN